MNRFDGLLNSAWSILIAGALAFAVVGCEGDTGPQGPAGPAGQDGLDGLDGAGLLPVDQAKAESCATCHNGIGTEHQEIYDSYVDTSNLTLTINSMSSAADGAGTFTVTTNFSVTQNGLPYLDADNLPLMDQKTFYTVQYDSTAREYLNSTTLFSRGFSNVGNIVSLGGGDYNAVTTGVATQPEVLAAPFDGYQVYGYLAQGPLFEHEGGSGAEIPEGSHVHLYDNVANAALAVGTAQEGNAAQYISAANVAGCEKCHGVPYLKHGYRAPQVSGLPDFASCKSCHYDDRNGNHRDWQYMVDRPFDWATGVALPAGKYDYTANIMNDVHMSHAMEFPYPQSAQNCNTCHAGKLGTILADTNFTAETCLSCHPLEGIDAYPKTFDALGNEILDRRGNPVPEKYGQPHRAPPLEYLWTRGPDLSFHDITVDCRGCHGPAAPNPIARSFAEFHTGYDVNITNAAGQRYQDLYSVSIDNITLAGNQLTVEFSASDPAIKPELLVSFYGWDSKHFIVASHTRDGSTACNDNGCRYEFAPGDTNPLFTEVATGVAGTWEVTANFDAYVPVIAGDGTLTDDIPTMITDGTIKRVEVTVTPELNLKDLAAPGPDLAVVLTAANATFDLAAAAVDGDYFKGANATVSTAKCNVCHDALASSFHSESGRGGAGIEVCKNCHVPTSPGSHLEMASRSIDSYVHAIHSFQDFDVGDTFGADGFDPVFAKRYDQHIHHVFPNFTIRNCEACHVKAGANDGAGGTFPVVYNVPDQTQSMPGLLSQSDVPLTWYQIVGGLAEEDPTGRNIGFVPEYVTGSASRACGGCHRARLIRDDAAGALTSFNAHTQQGGTLVENDDNDENLYDIIFKLMESVQ